MLLAVPRASERGRCWCERRLRFLKHI